MPALYLSCLLIYCIPFYCFGIIQSLQSFCISWEVSDIQKGHFHALWLRREIIVYVKLGFFKKIRPLLLLAFKKKVEKPQILVPFSDYFSTHHPQ